MSAEDVVIQVGDPPARLTVHATVADQRTRLPATPTWSVDVPGVVSLELEDDGTVCWIKPVGPGQAVVACVCGTLSATKTFTVPASDADTIVLVAS